MYTILTTCTPLDAALRECGHRVIAVPMREAGIYSMQSLVETAGVVPDIFIQVETLGKKILFNDLDTLNCLKVYWSIDTHLNYYWQRHYSVLFDIFCTPHAAYIAHLAPIWRHPQTLRLPIPGQARAWTPHSARTHDAVFVGRITQFRDARRRFCKVLNERYGLAVHDGLTQEAMLALYTQSRALPNECIAFEANFRLFEGASCGCCLITPAIGEDQDALFTPNAEILVYHDMCECVWLMDRCRRDVSLPERIGRAAYERIQHEHLPVHRARALLAACENAARVGLRGDAANSALWCALALLYANGQLQFDNYCEAVHRQVRNPVVRTYCLLCAATTRNDTEQIQCLTAHASTLPNTAPPDVWAAMAVLCGGAALMTGDIASSHYWHRRYEAHSGHGQTMEPEAPETCVDACAAWAASLVRDKKSLLHGLEYHKGRCLSALDMILLLSELNPFSTHWAEAMLADAHIVHTLPHLALTGLARLSLMREGDINISLRFIHTALRLFDAEQAQREYQDVLHRLNTPARESFMRLLRARIPHWEHA